MQTSRISCIAKYDKILLVSGNWGGNQRSHQKRCVPEFMASSSSETSSSSAGPGLPLIFGFCGGGFAALGFGAGFGASSYRRSVAFKELVEKFPEPPTAEAEALARSGASRALLGGTALAGLMGLGAVAVARANGIHSAQDLADEIKRWLPTRDGLEDSLAPKLAPLQRTITEHLQGARDASSGKFKKSGIGRYVSERAEQSAKAQKPLEPWEKVRTCPSLARAHARAQPLILGPILARTPRYALRRRTLPLARAQELLQKLEEPAAESPQARK